MSNHAFDPIPWLGTGWQVSEQIDPPTGDTGSALVPQQVVPTDTTLPAKAYLDWIRDNGHLPADATAFTQLWQDQTKIPKVWQDLWIERMPRLLFPGTLLSWPKSPGATKERFSCLYLCYHPWITGPASEPYSQPGWRWGMVSFLSFLEPHDLALLSRA